MELHLDRSFNYLTAGGQYWNIDFSQLPSSVQTGALDALRAGTPESLVTLGQLKEQFPDAFTQVSNARTLPAPDLSRSMDSSLLGAGVDMLLALLLNKIQETGVEMSATGRQNAVALSQAEMNLADAAKLEKDAAALKNMAGAVASGVVSMASGAGSFGIGLKSGWDSTAHNKAMKESNVSQRDTQDYQKRMEGHVKGLQDQAQADRAHADRLGAYASELDSSNGLSDASRQKLDKELQENKDQLAECDTQRNSYASAMVDAKHRSQDLTLTAAQRKQAQDELASLEKGKADFDADLGARETRLKDRQQSLMAVERMDAHAAQLKVDFDRRKELQDSGVRTPAEDTEMQALEVKLKQGTQKVVEERKTIQTHIDRLKSEATRTEDAAKALHKATQGDLAARQEVHAEKDKDITLKMDENKNRVTAASAGFQAVSGGGQAVGAAPQMLGQQDQAQADHIDALAKFFGVSRETGRAFADQLKEMADAAREGQKAMADQENELTKAIAGNIA